MPGHGSMVSHETSERGARGRHGDAAWWRAAAIDRRPRGHRRSSARDVPCSGRSAAPTRRTTSASRRAPNADCSRSQSTTPSPTATSPSSRWSGSRPPATKIGSLIINPGGPGESGVAGGRARWSKACRTRCGALRSRRLRSARRRLVDARGVVQLRRRQRSAAGRPQVDYTPAGVAHIESETKDFVQRCVDKMGKEFLANVGTANVVKDLDAMRGDARRREADVPRLLLRHPDRVAYAEQLPAQRARDDPRRRRRPQRRPDRGRHPAGRRVPDGVQRLRRRLREEPDLPARHRPDEGRRRLPRAWSIPW